MYMSVEEVRSYQIEALAAQTEEQLEQLIALYSGVVDEYCNTRFEPAAAGFAADVAKQIRLPKGPLLQVDSMAYQGSVLMADQDYYAYLEKGLVELADTAAYAQKKRALHITYQYGHETVPAIVKKAIMDLMQLDVQSGEYNVLAAQENWDGEYSYQRNTAKTAEDIRGGILSLLDIYRQPQYKPVMQGCGDVRARLL